MGFFDFLKRKEFEEIKQLNIKLLKYQPIIDIEKEVQRQRNQLQEYINTRENEIKQTEADYEKLKADYKEALGTYNNLKKEIGLYENKLDIVEYGVYEPVYDFEKSDDYRAEQKRIIELQKDAIRMEKAAICHTTWTIDGSEAKGRASTKKFIKLILRAFNGECDALVAKVKWNNVNQMKERIKKACDAINKLGESQKVSIQTDYLNLKLKELILEHEYQLKRQQEKEALRAAQEELREEEKARREYEQAQKEAEKEENNYQKALDKAKKEMEDAKGDKLHKLQLKIELLEQELKEAHEKKERALSMAQQTKRGHVYVISNIGSFGENVFKIGMTRRLEPLDRIKELGDASVPFQFDIHAMIFSEDAPTLENELHKSFLPKKTNLLNMKKEFFNVSIDEIENKVKEIGLNTEFTRLPEAMEYRETMAIIEKIRRQTESELDENLVVEDFPTSI